MTFKAKTITLFITKSYLGLRWVIHSPYKVTVSRYGYFLALLNLISLGNKSTSEIFLKNVNKQSTIFTSLDSVRYTYS
jgi:hypothetical protein